MEATTTSSLALEQISGTLETLETLETLIVLEIWLRNVRMNSDAQNGCKNRVSLNAKTLFKELIQNQTFLVTTTQVDYLA